MTYDTDKLSLTHRLRLREAELDQRRRQEARHKEVLVASEIERRILDDYVWLIQVETEASIRTGIVSRVAGFFLALFGKDRALGPQTAEEIMNFPEVRVARIQYERTVAEHARVAQRAGADVVRAIKSDAANDNIETNTTPPSTLADDRGSRWG